MKKAPKRTIRMKTWNDDPNKRALVIVRRSGPGQKENTSGETQEREIRAYCEERGIEIVIIESIIETAFKRKKRKKYHDQLEYALANNIRHIIFYHSSRETRNMTDHEMHEDLAKEGRIILHHVSDKKVYWKGTASSEWTAKAFHVVIDKGESADKSDRYKASYLTKAQNGWWPYRHTPLGYYQKSDLDRYGSQIKGTAKLTPVPDKRELEQIVKEFTLRAEGLSYDEIAETMWVEKKHWAIKGTKSGYRATISKRLKNPLYWGYFYLKDDPRRWDGKHELIIPEKILKLVKQINDGKPGRPTRPKNEQGLFADGWLKCGHSECGLQICYDPKKKKIKSTGKEKTYKFYRCTNRKKIHKPNPSIKEDKIMEQFESAVDEYDITEEFAKDVMDYLNESHEKAVEAHRKQGEAHKEALKELEQKEDKLTDLLVEGTIAKNIYDRRLRKVREERDHYNDQLDDLHVLISDASHVAVKKVFELAINSKSLWKSMDASGRVDYLKKVCSNPTLDDLSVRYHLQAPFDRLTKMRENNKWRREVYDFRTECVAWAA